MILGYEAMQLLSLAKGPDRCACHNKHGIILRNAKGIPGIFVQDYVSYHSGTHLHAISVCFVDLLSSYEHLKVNIF